MTPSTRSGQALAESRPFPLTLRSPEVATGGRRASRRTSGNQRCATTKPCDDTHLRIGCDGKEHS